MESSLVKQDVRSPITVPEIGQVVLDPCWSLLNDGLLHGPGFHVLRSEMGNAPARAKQVVGIPFLNHDWIVYTWIFRVEHGARRPSLLYGRRVLCPDTCQKYKEQQ